MEAETPPWRGLRLVSRDGPVFRTRRDYGPGAGTFHYHEVEENGRLMVSTCTTEEGAGGEALRRTRSS